MMKLLLVLVFLCHPSFSSQAIAAEEIPKKVITHLKYLAVIEKLADLCALDSTLTASEAQSFWDIAIKKDDTVNWAMERFNDENLFLITTDWESSNHEQFYLDQINSHGGCNNSLLVKLRKEIDEVKAAIRNDSPTITKDSPIWMLILFVVCISVIFIILKFILNLFGIKLD